jgi:hypothetical protein
MRLSVRRYKTRLLDEIEKAVSSHPKEDFPEEFHTASTLTLAEIELLHSELRLKGFI